MQWVGVLYSSVKKISSYQFKDIARGILIFDGTDIGSQPLVFSRTHIYERGGDARFQFNFETGRKGSCRGHNVLNSDNF